MHLVLRLTFNRTNYFYPKKINFTFFANLNYSNGELPGFKVCPAGNIRSFHFMKSLIRNQKTVTYKLLTCILRRVETKKYDLN